MTYKKGGEIMKVSQGIWTPWALLLCMECHGPEFPRKTFDTDSEEWRAYLTPQYLEDGKGVTNCDKCDCEIQVDIDIAHEHNLARRLRERGRAAEMEQTGGMNHAGRLNTPDGGYYLFLYNWEGNELWELVRFDDEGEPVNREPLEFREEEELFDHILNLEDVKRL